MFGDIALTLGVVNEFVRTDVDGIHLCALDGIRPHHLILGAEGDGGLAAQGYLLD